MSAFAVILAAALLDVLPKEKNLEALHPFGDDSLDWLKQS